MTNMLLLGIHKLKYFLCYLSTFCCTSCPPLAPTCKRSVKSYTRKIITLNIIFLPMMTLVLKV